MKLSARFRPSPAMVVATLALLVALTGTGVAAVALAPKNSVGSDQVINGSLRSVDFKSNQILTASDTVSQSFGSVNLPAGDKSFYPVASISISKPGAYVISAHAQVISPVVGSGASCLLIARGIPNGAGGTPDAVQAPSWIDPTQGIAAPTMWMALVHGFSSGGGSVDLMCAGGARGLPQGVKDIRITAVRLGGAD